VSRLHRPSTDHKSALSSGLNTSNAPGATESSTSVLRARYAQAQRTFAHIVAEHVRTFYRLGDAGDATLEFAAMMIITGTKNTLMAWLDGHIPASLEQLSDIFADFAVD
jgi:hypothetical protein